MCDCLLLLCTSGCAKQLKDVDNKIVKVDSTGQTLTQNILCRPMEEETIKKYNEVLENSKQKLKEQLDNKEITQKQYDKKINALVDINKLSKCSEFSITDGGYEGWNLGVDYALAKNVQLCVNCYDTDSKLNNLDDQVWYSELYFFF